jgi:hypothetical protein
MKHYKVFIQAVRKGEGGAEERMFKYDEDAPDADAARRQAQVKFDLEWAVSGWEAESAGVLEF